MLPSFVMSLFRAGNDTQQIANSLNRSEAEIYNLIAAERERERLTQAA
ncbi:hypothetical protein QEZ48_19645 [Aquamicrobium lusatiense]|nr:hypothetical protein [Aquamicrobium lusatiense]MDH4993032.1 hypothetical protein [Aquamicrobium lusatiense]